jgi:hypothetical protein
MRAGHVSQELANTIARLSWEQWLAPRHPRQEKPPPELAVFLSTPTLGASSFSHRMDLSSITIRTLGR